LKNCPDAVVVIEPGLHQAHGHMRGELELFLSGLRANKVPFQVVGSEKPLSVVPEDWNLHTPPEFLVSFLKVLPSRISVRLIEFLTYLFAFHLAAKENSPTIGLTSSGPFGLFFACLFQAKSQRNLFITRHIGSAESAGSLWHLFFGGLLRNKAVLGFYSILVKDRLRKTFPAYSNQLKFLPEVSATNPLVQRSHKSGRTLLISGLDCPGRRSPIRHLERVGEFPFAKLILHDPNGLFKGCELLQNTLGKNVEVEKVSGYFLEDYSNFLASADVVFIAYDPIFMNPSSVLRHSVCAGVPVISSRFPDFVFLENKFGPMGETWEYNDFLSLKAAFERYLKWLPEDFNEFDRTSKDLSKYLSPPSVVCEHLKTIGFNMQ
jgi:hypothetical protein